jgi:hypothetical protein
MSRDVSLPARPRSNRRGATLVMVALSLTVLVMFAGLGVDVARMRLYKGQLEALADAAALSLATDLRLARSRGTAVAAARRLRDGHRLTDGQLATLAGGDLEQGQWDFATQQFAATSWANATAVRAQSRYTARWTLATIFGVRTQALSATAVASLGAVARSGCLTPLAFPYGALLQQLGLAPTQVSYGLAASDVARLRSARTQQAFVLSAPSGTVAAAFGVAALGGAPSSTTDVANAMRPGCTSPSVAVGDDVPFFTGSMASPDIVAALDALCPGAGDLTNRRCTPAPLLEVPVYVNAPSATAIRVQYVGAFRLTRVAFTASSNRIFGYFSVAPARSASEVLPRVGPVYAAALVQ